MTLKIVLTSRACIESISSPSNLEIVAEAENIFSTTAMQVRQVKRTQPIPNPRGYFRRPDQDLTIVYINEAFNENRFVKPAKIITEMPKGRPMQS